MFELDVIAAVMAAILTLWSGWRVAHWRRRRAAAGPPRNAPKPGPMLVATGLFAVAFVTCVVAAIADHGEKRYALAGLIAGGPVLVVTAIAVALHVFAMPREHRTAAHHAILVCCLLAVIGVGSCYGIAMH